MDDSFYLVPITDAHTYIDDKKICDLCEEKVDQIQELERKREANSKKIFPIRKLFDNYYKSVILPEYLIVVRKGDIYRELMTGLEINTDDALYLNRYEVDNTENILVYFTGSDYKNRIINLIKSTDLKNDKSLIKRISGF